VLNHRILVNNHPALVVGIARRQFHGLLSGRNPDFYIPLSAISWFDATLATQRNQPDYYWLSLFGRLKPGVSSERATAALRPLFDATLTSELPRFKDVSARNRKQILADSVNTEPAAQGLNQLQMQWQAPLLVLMAMVGLVLLMACVNVANLLMARAAGREREFAIRLAVGATKVQVFRQLLVESLLLSVSGGIIGLIVSGALTMGLLSVIPPDTFSGWLSPQINWTLFGFSIALAIVTGVLFGMAPAWQAVRPVLASALREKTSGISAGSSKGRFRQALVAVQVCLSLFLLIGAGLFTRSLINLLNNNPGFHADHLVTFNIDPSLVGYSPARSFSLDRELLNELGAIPGVHSVALANLLPLAGDNIGTGLSANGRADNMISTNENPVGPGYFHTLGIPLVEGREFRFSDTSQSPRVVILNQKFAHELFPKESAVGRHVLIGPQASDTEIVGVVKDSKFDGLREDPRHLIYVPNEQNNLLITGQTVFFLRTGNSEKATIGSIPGIVKRLDSTLPVNNLTTMQSFIDSTIYTDRLMALLAIAFGVLATLLAAVGLYGIISYSVTRRTQEFGIRLALGAERSGIIRLVIREIAWLVAIGLIIGLPLSYALALLIQSQLFGIRAYDPIVLVGATLILIVAAGLAGWIPALRAMRIEPTQALRYE
jgi:predicted permease